MGELEAKQQSNSTQPFFLFFLSFFCHELQLTDSTEQTPSYLGWSDARAKNVALTAKSRGMASAEVHGVHRESIWLNASRKDRKFINRRYETPFILGEHFLIWGKKCTSANMFPMGFFLSISHMFRWIFHGWYNHRVYSPRMKRESVTRLDKHSWCCERRAGRGRSRTVHPGH